MPKVSVIVPIYKVEKYLRAGIDCILAQTYKDYEIILVDDGSPDGCGRICDEYAEKYDNIRVIHKENGGLSSARNAGLDISAGEFVCFFDPDDTISPRLFEKCIEMLDRDGSDAIRFGFLMYLNGEVVEYNTVKIPDSVEMCRTGEEKLSFIKNKLFGSTMWSACTCLFSNDIIKKYDLRFADNRKIYAEDMYFACLFTLYANKISLLGEPLYNYIRREDSIMGQTQSVVKLNEINRLSHTLYQYVNDEFLLENYHFIHNLIIMNQIKRLPELKSMGAAKEYDKYLAGIEQKSFFDEQIKKHVNYLKKNRKANGLYCGWYSVYTENYLVSQNKVSLWFNIILWKAAYLPYKVLKFLFKRK